MKRFATIVIALCVFLGLSAQENNTFRFGYLSYEQALKSMSQYAVMQKKMADLEAQYQAETKRVEDEFNRKYEEFLEGQREFPKTILQKRQVELQELMEKNIAFKDESRQQLASAEEEMTTPLKEQLSGVIAKSFRRQYRLRCLSFYRPHKRRRHQHACAECSQVILVPSASSTVAMEV